MHPYPELVDRDTTSPQMRHIALERSVYACGASRDPMAPLQSGRMDEFDCVVCVDIWRAQGPWDVA